MKHRALLVIFAVLCVMPHAGAQDKSGVKNPAIDMEGYLRISLEASGTAPGVGRGFHPNEPGVRDSYPGRAKQAEI